jgi:hypothetical protein
MKKDEIVNLELIKLLCLVSILNSLRKEHVVKDFKDLSFKNILS